MAARPASQRRGAAPALRLGSLGTVALLFASSCAMPVGPGAGGPPVRPTIAAVTSTDLSRPTYVVKRGTIIDAIKVLGKVISAQESDLYFRTNGRLKKLYVDVGQQVKAGDLLAELETGDLANRIRQAQTSLASAQLKVQQVQAKVVIDDSDVDQANLEQARANLEQAQRQVERLQAGPQDQDVKAAESAVADAQAALDKAKADLAARQADLQAKQAELALKQQTPTQDDLAAAQAAVEAARIKLQQVSAGPTKEDVQAAELAVAKAETKLAQLRDAPPASPADLANAELAVQQAQVNLDKARADTSGTPAQHEANVRLAELALETAQNNLAKLQNSQTSQWDLRLAELDVQAAKNNLAKLKSISPSDVRAAQVAYDLAVAKLQALQQGPNEQDIANLKSQIESLQLAVQSAQAAVPSAQAALAAAQAKLDAIKQGATDFDLREAQLKVQQAQTALDTAQAQLDLKKQSLGLAKTAADFDVQVAQKAVEAAKVDLGQLQAQYDDSRIIAPTDGLITRVNGKPGATVQAFDPVVSLSGPGDRLVRANVLDADIPRLAVGEKVQLTIDSIPNRTFDGTVRDLPSSVVTQTGVVADKSTKIAVDWGDAQPALGQLARVQIIVQKKDDVLIVPTSAIRTVGKRRFVEYMDNGVKRSRSVETGISTDQDTEIVSGLQEGETILAGT